MILTPHILAGAAVGSKIHNYWLVAVFSVLLHFILDIFPHKEYEIEGLKTGKLNRQFLKDMAKVLLDLFAGVAIVVYLGIKTPNIKYMLTGAFFGCLPDFLMAVYYIFHLRILKYLENFHFKIHFFRNYPDSNSLRILSQVVAALVAIILLIK